MALLSRNNLDRSASPYLRQHAGNPVWWQEWGPEALAAAAEEGKPLFVSVGYSTCHWCHVMAREAFSDPATADLLNEHFVSVKVDRETRPDIDQYLMAFLVAQTGSGGWPLNVFLSPEGTPVFALTYAPPVPRAGRPSLFAIAQRILEFFVGHRGKLTPFDPRGEGAPAVPESDSTARLLAALDPVFGGFGPGPKFPPHSTLLFMLYKLTVDPDAGLEKACRLTLDAMRRGGLHDHLQGGVFRYCVDRAWTIPHFEKMLYDQAMALWTYALAARALGDEGFASMAAGIVRCLEETFAAGPLFATAHDADTGGREGLTYLWRPEELESVLTKEEYGRLAGSYRLPREGNFEGAIHLTRADDRPLGDVEAKLLEVRKRRPQPKRDDKILCGTNALTACALVQAGRLLERPELEARAERTIESLLDVFWDGSSLGHSLSFGLVQRQSFLADAAAVLLALTMLRETDDRWADIMGRLGDFVGAFRRDGRWLESSLADFRPVAASRFDHPVPSSVSLAAMGQARRAVLEGGTAESLDDLPPLESDFHNVAAMIGRGLFHEIRAEHPLPWDRLPVNAIQVRSGERTDCYRGACRRLDQALFRPS